MKILTVVYDLDIGGTQRAAQVYAQAYQVLGHDSRVLAVDALGPRCEELQSSEVYVYKVLSSSIIDEIRGWKPDLIHLHSHNLREVDVRGLIDNLTPRPAVVETNVFSRPSPWEDLLDSSFQLGNWALGLYKMRGGSDVGLVLPYAVVVSGMRPASPAEIEAFRRDIDVPNDAFVLGRIGQPYPGKWDVRIVGIFDALCEKNTDCYFVCIGAPDSIREAFLKSPNIKNVRFIDRVVGDQKLSIAYTSFDVFLLAADQGESFGMVLAEAALCQVPVVTLATPWGDNTQCEVVVDGESGYVNLTMRGAVQSIQKLHGSAKLRHSMGMNAAKLVERFCHLKLADKVIQIAKGLEVSAQQATESKNYFNWKAEERPPLGVRLLLTFGNRTSLYLCRYIREDVGVFGVTVRLSKRVYSRFRGCFK